MLICWFETEQGISGNEAPPLTVYLFLLEEINLTKASQLTKGRTGARGIVLLPQTPRSAPQIHCIR